MTLTRKQKRNIYIAFQVLKLLFTAIYWIVVVGGLLWFAWSFIEVQIHNLTMLDPEPYQYSSFNLFTLLSEWAANR